ncbi:hypothetical protein [Planctobacterium marinum]|uniref:Uncharacterized protein n=1 Tax=Planctobacterium marinum TaxID=1631968 RepID=A0AA48KRF3_9ALTE|nr:hypothetical protein MACH26_08800 [Planctobacterium marinum]
MFIGIGILFKDKDNSAVHMVVNLKSKTERDVSPLSVLRGFSEFLLIPAFILAFFAFSEYQRISRLNQLSYPLVNDFYLMDYSQVNPGQHPEYRYVTIKINSIEQDQIVYQYSNYAHSDKVPIQKHVQFDVALNYGYFNAQEQRVSRAEFEQWREDGIIYDGARPESLYIDGWLVLRPADAVRGHELNIKQHALHQ